MELKNIFNFNNSTKVINYYKNKTNTLVSYNQLKQFKIGKIVEMIPSIPGAITTVRIPSKDEETSLAFRVEMRKGFKWNPHFHDCWETIIIYKGEFKDLISGKVASRGNQMLIKPNTVHEIECTTESSIFYIEFTKIHD